MKGPTFFGKKASPAKVAGAFVDGERVSYEDARKAEKAGEGKTVEYTNREAAKHRKDEKADYIADHGKDAYVENSKEHDDEWEGKIKNIESKRKNNKKHQAAVKEDRAYQDRVDAGEKLEGEERTKSNKVGRTGEQNADLKPGTRAGATEIHTGNSGPDRPITSKEDLAQAEKDNWEGWYDTDYREKQRNKADASPAKQTNWEKVKAAGKGVYQGVKTALNESRDSSATDSTKWGIQSGKRRYEEAKKEYREAAAKKSPAKHLGHYPGNNADHTIADHAKNFMADPMGTTKKVAKQTVKKAIGGAKKAKKVAKDASKNKYVKGAAEAIGNAATGGGVYMAKKAYKALKGKK